MILLVTGLIRYMLFVEDVILDVCINEIVYPGAAGNGRPLEWFFLFHMWLPIGWYMLSLGT